MDYAGVLQEPHYSQDELLALNPLLLIALEWRALPYARGMQNAKNSSYAFFTIFLLGKVVGVADPSEPERYSGQQRLLLK